MFFNTKKSEESGKSRIFSMKVTPEYKQSAFIVPASALEHLKDADGTDLACLLYVLGQDEFTVTGAAVDLGVEEQDLIKALNFWESRGVISTGSKKSSEQKNKKVSESKKAPVKTPVKSSSSLPVYTSEETARFLESNKTTAEIIDSCENIIGKIFTTAETNIVIGMLDHLALSGDYILLLFAHAAKIGKKSLRYIEKLALSFSDKNITEYSELEEALADIELCNTTQKHVRNIFGIGRRAFTEKEQKFVYNWCVKFAYGKDIISRAYEVTVNNTGNASLSYANAVLENWFKAELHTLEQIDESLAANKKDAKSGTESDKSSFDTDDFFEAALKRSYGN